MRVRIKSLVPNPFRDFENYPIDMVKIESLIKSIEETGLWDNLLARKKGGQIQLSYGHNRFVALRIIHERQLTRKR